MDLYDGMMKDVLEYRGKKESFNIQQVHNMTGFMRANYDKIKMWTVGDDSKTYVVFEWPHVVPELKILQ